MKAKLMLIVMLAVFAFTSVAIAAGDPWFIIKDKNGVCKIIQAKDKTPATIAGPYKVKVEAEKAKDKACAANKK